MKRTTFYLVTMLTILSCSKEDDPTPTKEPFKISITDMVYITEQTNTTKAASTEHLTGLEIVKQTREIQLQNIYSWSPGEVQNMMRGFQESQRDFTSKPPKLMMYATDIITESLTLQEDFISAFNVVLVRYIDEDFRKQDTIAYIPNATLRAAETQIRAAFEAKDMEACINLFNEAYKFIPITGEEWQALKAQNLQ